MLFLPEIRLKKICDALIEYLVTDLEECLDSGEENKSYLYLLFHEDEYDNTSSEYYNQAKELFLRKESDPRYLKIYPIFDRRRAELPTIHIVVPQDSESILSIGDIEGDVYQETLSEKLERGFETQFNLITTSNNIMEVIIINYVLRALLIGSISNLAVLGFINPRFSVQDLTARPELFPANTYVKGLAMFASYSDVIPTVGKSNGVQRVIFNLNKIKY